MPKKSNIDDLLIDLTPMYRGLNEYRDMPLAKAKRKMKALGFAAKVDALKKLFRSRRMTAGEAEIEIARRFGIEVDALRKRMQRVK
jgi:hypothetical protein